MSQIPGFQFRGIVAHRLVFRIKGWHAVCCLAESHAMRNLILVLLILAGGILVYKCFIEPEPTHAAADPSRRFEEILDQGQASASELAQLCQRHPLIAQRYLPHALLRLDGTIRTFHLTGVSKNILDVQFDSPTQKKISMRLDLQRYNNLLVENIAARHARYEIVGYEVLMFAPQLGPSGKVIYRVGQKIAERGRFFGFGAADVCFNAE
jgi:hypothetical protein